MEDVKEYEKNLMINLHERNMRRSTSQMETKQSQSSIYLDDNEVSGSKLFACDMDDDGKLKLTDIILLLRLYLTKE